MVDSPVKHPGPAPFASERVGGLRAYRVSAAKAFSLIELMMVLAIIGIVTAVTVPQLVQSMRGNRLRLAARQVVSAGRYARSMALLEQREMELVFDPSSGEVRVAPAGTRTLDEMPSDAGAWPMASVESSSADETPAVSAEGRSTGVRMKLDRVRIESVRVGQVEKPTENEARRVVYGTNGRCTPYTVVLRDAFETAVTIEVDALASARTSMD